VSKNLYITKKEIIEELVYKDRNFFSSSNSEFNIFKYTSFFAVLTFTFQSIVVMTKSFNGLSYLTYRQFLVIDLSIIFIIGLIELYYGLTCAIRKSYHNGKGLYLRLYKCKSCDFTSYSEFYSNLHIVSYPEHTLKDNQILIKYEKFKCIQWFSRLSVISRRKTVEKNSDHECASLSESTWRITNEIISSKRNKPRLIDVIRQIPVIAFSAYVVYYVYSIFRSPEAVIPYLILIGIFLLISNYITHAVTKEDTDNVYILKLDLVYQGEKGNPKINFQCFTMSSLYWDCVENSSEIEPIEVQDGNIYIVDKVCRNKFGEIVKVIPE